MREEHRIDLLQNLRHWRHGSSEWVMTDRCKWQLLEELVLREKAAYQQIRMLESRVAKLEHSKLGD